MSTGVLLRDVLDSLLPHGAAHEATPGGNLDNLYTAIAKFLEGIHDQGTSLQYIRNAAGTPILSDLEQEYGILPSPGQTISQRQAILAYHKVKRGLSGQWWVLQNAITSAGFTGVNVIPNDPAVNSAPFLGGTAQAWCGNTTSVCGYLSTGTGGVVTVTWYPAGGTYVLLGPGEIPGAQPAFKSQGPQNARAYVSGGTYSITVVTTPNAAANSSYILLGPGETPGKQPAFKAQGPPGESFASSGGPANLAPVYGAYCSAPVSGQLVVNGQQYLNAGTVLGCGSGIQCHQIWPATVNNNLCGSFVYTQQALSQFGPPQEPGRYGLVFFVAGAATYDATGRIATLTQASVPSGRVQELATLILRYKPLHTWCALLMNAV